jgi:hypothetical protein
LANQETPGTGWQILRFVFAYQGKRKYEAKKYGKCSIFGRSVMKKISVHCHVSCKQYDILVLLIVTANELQYDQIVTSSKPICLKTKLLQTLPSKVKIYFFKHKFQRKVCILDLFCITTKQCIMRFSVVVFLLARFSF